MIYRSKCFNKYTLGCSSSGYSSTVKDFLTNADPFRRDEIRSKWLKVSGQPKVAIDIPNSLLFVCAKNNARTIVEVDSYAPICQGITHTILVTIVYPGDDEDLLFG